MNETLIKLHELMGYIQNGSDGCITIYQDDCTKNYHIVRKYTSAGKTIWDEYGASLEEAINVAHKKHGQDYLS